MNRAAGRRSWALIWWILLPVALVVALLAFDPNDLAPPSDLVFRVVDPNGGTARTGESLETLTIPAVFQHAVAGLATENGSPVCYIKVHHLGRSSSAQIKVLDQGGLKGGTSVTSVKSMDGAAWVHRWNGDEWQISATLPLEGRFLVAHNLWAGEAVMVDGSKPEEVHPGVVALNEGTHEFVTARWVATLDAADSTCVQFLEWEGGEPGGLEFGYEEGQFSKVSVGLDNQELASLPSSPSTLPEATEYDFLLDLDGSRSCRVRIRRLASPGWFLAIRVTYGLGCP